MSPNLQETADLVTFTEEILNGKLHFLCSDAEIGIQRPAQNILAKKWLINSIYKSLDENCYDPHDFGVVEDLSSEF